MIGSDPAVPAAIPRSPGRLILLFIAFLVTQVCYGGEAPAPRIRAIEIKGNQKVETSTIQFYIRNRVGDEFSVARIREDILRIYRLGFFKDVQVDVEEFEGGLKANAVIRPLPSPPRCRGIEIEPGHYTGCAFGYGDVPPFTEPCDCPVCNGSGFERGYEPN